MNFTGKLNWGPVNTGSQIHVTETLKNAEKIPRPSGDLIPRNMQSRHVSEEPQQPGSVIFSALYLIIDFSPARGFYYMLVSTC